MTAGRATTIHVLPWRDLDDIEAGGSELHADRIAHLWADAGIDVTMRTSFAAGSPAAASRRGYRVVRRGGCYMVFPPSRAGRVGRLAPMPAPVALGIAALFVLIQQYRFRYPPDFIWPFRFESVHILGMAAIVALACDYAVTVAQARSLQRRSTSGASKPG